MTRPLAHSSQQPVTTTSSPPLRYIIAFLARERAGLLDCDVAVRTPSLCTDGASFIRQNRDRILDAYSHFAERTADEVGPQAEVLWMIEPDFHQYSEAGQKGGGLCASISIHSASAKRIAPRRWLAIYNTLYRNVCM